MNTFTPFEESRFETKHEITVRGKKIPFLTVAEDFVLCDENGEAEASLFSYSYLVCREKGQAERPVLFIWDGGPGCSAGVENLRSFGPWRLKNAPGSKFMAPNPPYELEDNPDCLLDVCDLVMVDPVGTGYGQLLKKDSRKYFSVDGDAKAMALFIEAWLTENKRWNSPRYLMGTSYGTIRVARVLEELNGGAFHKNGVQRSIPVNGVILDGCGLAINETATSALPEGVEPTLLLMRSMAAVNCFHKLGSRDIAAFCNEAEDWAFTELKDFYENGGDEARTAQIGEKLSLYTGLPVPVLESFAFKLPAAEVFSAMLLADQGLDLGIYDARMTLQKNNSIGLADPAGDDPGMGVYTPAIVGAMNGPFKEKMGITFNRRYIYQDYGINGSWDWSYPETVVEQIPRRTHMQCLAAAMRRNEKMHTLFATGSYDLCTWTGTNKYLAENSELPAERVTVAEYPSGHMAFADFEACEKLAADISALILQSLA